MVMFQNMPASGRRYRRPQYPFYMKQRPWEVVPFLLAPVLPGETMKDALFQSRVVTDPIKNRLVGWWTEYYFFYVRLRDLAGAADFEQMMLDPDKDMTAHMTAASAPYFHNGSINWRKMATDKIVEHYFRADDETLVQDAGFDYLHASIDQTSVLDSAIRDADFIGDADLNVNLNADANIMASEVDKAMRMWQFARTNELTDMDFDDYLRTFGIKVAPAESDKPELLRFVRDWQYPSNTVDPTNGAAVSAVSWSVRDKISKDRFFKEPGFIVGLSLCRPKIYLGTHVGSFASRMDDALAWLPAIMRDDPYTSLRKFASATNSPLSGQATDYWVDIKDLFLYGEQFTNDMTTAPKAALPTASLQKRYASLADAKGLFVGNDVSGLQYVRQDGVINLHILGNMTDTTPSVARMSV